MLVNIVRITPSSIRAHMPLSGQAFTENNILVCIIETTPSNMLGTILEIISNNILVTIPKHMLETTPRDILVPTIQIT
jgi:hypothetical protein